MDNLFNLYGVDSIRQMFAELYESHVFVIDKTGQKTLELINASFVSNKHVIFGEVNDDYAKKELEWYKTGINNINAMEPPVPALWRSTAGDDGSSNSNYGWCVHSSDNGFQFSNVVLELIANPLSRRATMIYTRPTMWYDYKSDGKSDFICTNNVQYFIRNNRLETCVFMRSNDAVFGYAYDRIWQLKVREDLYSQLKMHYPDLKLGTIMWNAGSLHVYERHFYLVEHFSYTNDPSVSKADYAMAKEARGNGAISDVK